MEKKILGWEEMAQSTEKRLAFPAIKMDVASTVTEKDTEKNVWRCNRILSVEVRRRGNSYFVVAVSQ